MTLTVWRPAKLTWQTPAAKLATLIVNASTQVKDGRCVVTIANVRDAFPAIALLPGVRLPMLIVRLEGAELPTGQVSITPTLYQLPVPGVSDPFRVLIDSDVSENYARRATIARTTGLSPRKRIVSGDEDYTPIEIDHKSENEELVKPYGRRKGSSEARESNQSRSCQKKSRSRAKGGHMALVVSYIRPRNPSEVLSGPDADKWREAMQVEVENLIGNGTWELVDRPNDINIVSNQWVFKVKAECGTLTLIRLCYNWACGNVNSAHAFTTT
ncbi:hypothetical protein Ae201684_014543 [Aphanomyces euteiches]|uniref:Reverse transcriptase Ty1/copia-type domain-containing protein n=1 Tax=Aphanomyces euteiches TaxID=100861 RepID=A0A6G0WJN7_9STRA|nr:hypothetical protein Ae201684_014543 [Aphanomyces euteiches]